MSKNIRDKVSIVGVGACKFGENWDQSREDMIVDAAYEAYADAGIDTTFVQDNFSHSEHGTLRGLHYQIQQSQGKLLRVVRGEVFDVAVDMRESSPTFAQWVGVTLSAENRKLLWIPPQFAHGLLVLSDIAEFEYKCTDFYYPESEIVVAWDDPAIGIEWPIDEPLLSQRDADAPALAALGDRLPAYQASG